MHGEEPAEVDDEQRDGPVEYSLLPPLPGLDLAPPEVAPEEVRDHRDGDEEREPQQRARGHDSCLGLQRDDPRRDRGEDQQVPDERVHEVMYARTPSAAATSVAIANQSRRARGSSGAYSHGERTASRANVP